MDAHIHCSARLLLHTAALYGPNVPVQRFSVLSSGPAGTCQCTFTPLQLCFPQNSCVLPQTAGEASSATTTALLRGMSLHGCDPTAQHHPCWEGHLMPKGEKCCKTQGRHCSARLLPVCCASMAAHLGIPLKTSRNTRSSTEDYCKEESQKVLAEQHPV